MTVYDSSGDWYRTGWRKAGSGLWSMVRDSEGDKLMVPYYVTGSSELALVSTYPGQCCAASH